MRIKEIEWDRSGIIRTASLPFGYTADICPRTDGFYQWSIRRGPALIKGDYTITQDGSELACQAAWEKMVMESFEENRGCDFCHELGRYQRADLRDNGRGSIGTLINCSADNPKTNIKSNWSFVAKRHMEIQLIGGVLYCPFCGRKLPQGKEQDNDVFKYVREWEKKKNEEGES